MARKLGDRRMRRMMKNLKVEEIDAVEVIIKTPTEEIVLDHPNVTMTLMQGIEVYQVMGGEKRVRAPGSSDESGAESNDFDVSSLKQSDIELVAKQGGVDLEEAKQALAKAKGDLATAVMILRSKKK